jgi:hypothetical protein
MIQEFVIQCNASNGNDNYQHKLDEYALTEFGEQAMRIHEVSSTIVGVES